MTAAKSSFPKAKKALDALIGQPIFSIGRACDMLCLTFGDPVEKACFVRDENGKAVAGRATVGSHALHVSGMFRLLMGSELLLASGDLWQPSAAVPAKAHEAGQDWIDEETKVSDAGNNLLDERLAEHAERLKGYRVENVRISRVGDLTVLFSGGLKLQAVIDATNDAECWRYFAVGQKGHTVITGMGPEPCTPIPHTDIELP